MPEPTNAEQPRTSSGALVPRDVAELVLPAAACVLAYLLSRHLLIYSHPWLQLAALPALIVASLARRITAALLASVSLGLVALAVPPTFVMFGGSKVPGVLLFALSAAAASLVVGGVVLWAGRHLRHAVGTAAAVVALVLVLGNMVVTANFINTSVGYSPLPPTYEYVRQVPIPGKYADDASTFVRVYYDMAAGGRYYESFRAALRGDAGWGKDPVGPFGYRMPTVFWIWQAQPWGPEGIPKTLLALQIASVLALTLALGRYLPLGAAVASSTGLAAYSLFLSTTHYTVWVEPWALPFAVASISAVLVAEKSAARGRLWWWIAAAFALIAMLVREQFVLLAIAGLATSLLEPRLRRSRAWIPWVVSISSFAVAWGLHISVALRMSSSQAFTWTTFAGKWLNGGIEHLRVGIGFAMAYISDGRVGPVLVAAVGLLGVLAAPGAIRWFLGLATAEGLVMLLAFGNISLSASGSRIGYWGVFLMPYLLAAMPFVLLPLVTPVARPVWADRESDQ